MQLTDREKRVLEALVELFIQEAGPVSSGHLQTESRLGVSSATIRNTLHSLEDKGYLHQPHTSAGRVPTAEAYRVYAHDFCRPARLPERLLARIRNELETPQVDDVQALLARFSKLLAGLSHNVGVGFAFDMAQEATIERIEIVMLEGQRLLAVVTFDDGDVRTSILPLEAEVGSHDLEIAVVLLDEIVVGCTTTEARDKLEVALQTREHAAFHVARVIAHESHRVFEDRHPKQVHLEGASQIMGEPEFQDPENLKRLVRLLEEPLQLQTLFDETDACVGPSIRIGRGERDEDEWPFSLVSARCEIAGHTGFVGILGPMRMRYALAMSLVSSVVGTLEGFDAHRSEDGGRA